MFSRYLDYRERMFEEVSPVRIARAEYFHADNSLHLLFRDGDTLHIVSRNGKVIFDGDANSNRLPQIPNGELEAIFRDFSEDACLLLQQALKEAKPALEGEAALDDVPF